jgi:hypothetical protein
MLLLLLLQQLLLFLICLIFQLTLLQQLLIYLLIIFITFTLRYFTLYFTKAHTEAIVNFTAACCIFTVIFALIFTVMPPQCVLLLPQILQHPEAGVLLVLH